jgi:hypothetical protein
MRPERSQTGTISFRPYGIIYNRCLHETRTKITQNDQVIPPAEPSRLTSDLHEFRLV